MTSLDTWSLATTAVGLTTPTPTRLNNRDALTARMFQSDMLHYRAIEPSDADFLHSIQSDAAAFANSSSCILVPGSRANSQKWQDYLVKNHLIAVIICLPAVPNVPALPSVPAVPIAALPAKDGDKKPEDTPIGVISLTGTSPERSHHRNAHVSVDIKAGYRGRGFGREAIEWIMDWGFRYAGLHSVAIEAMSWNEGALRLYSNIGFTPEGRRREVYWFDGEWHDEVEFSMLEGEWKAIKEARTRDDELKRQGLVKKEK